MATRTRYVTADDGLPAETVGPWAKRKHKILADYAFASGGARARFRGAKAAFIDVFCGPGRSIVRTTGEYIDGSAIAAFKSGNRSPSPFSSIEISDAKPRLLSAATQRLASLHAPVTPAPEGREAEARLTMSEATAS